MKKLILRMRNAFSRLSFSTKLFLSYFLLFSLVIGVFFSINFKHVTQMNEDQMRYTNEQAMQQTVSFLEYKLSSLRNIINIISSDETIQTILKTSDTYYRENQGNWFIQTTDMKNIIYNSYLTSDIHSVRLYMKNGPASFEETNEFKRLSDAERSEWYSRLDNTALLGTVWVPSSFFDTKSADYVSIIKRIPDFNSINKYVGIIKGDVPGDIFHTIVAQTSTTVNSTVALFNAHGEMIAFSGDKQFINVSELQNALTQNALPADGTLHPISLHDERFLAGTQNIGGSDWTLMMLIPDRDLLASTRLYRNPIILLLLATVGGALPITYFTSRYNASRVRRLQQHMRESVESNFSIAPLNNGNDEIGELTRTFDEMSNRINQLLEEQYRLGYEIKNLELKVLQSLINPHFLYNTLDMIYWLSVQQNALKSAVAAKELARFYKLSLGHGEYFVSLSQELEHVKTYVALQNMRFDHKIELRCDVPTALMDCPVIKIILQPLVENSILHGILEKSTGSGTLFLHAREKNGTVHLTVADNGVGMPPQQLAALTQKPSNGQGYGVWNIMERLRVTYGAPYGLHFSSTLQKGTCAFVTFPRKSIEELPAATSFPTLHIGTDDKL